MMEREGSQVDSEAKWASGRGYVINTYTISPFSAKKEIIGFSENAYYYYGCRYETRKWSHYVPRYCNRGDPRSRNFTSLGVLLRRLDSLVAIASWATLGRVRHLSLVNIVN